jgi:hypothetical protein
MKDQEEVSSKVKANYAIYEFGKFVFPWCVRKGFMMDERSGRSIVEGSKS